MPVSFAGPDSLLASAILLSFCYCNPLLARIQWLRRNLRVGQLDSQEDFWASSFGQEYINRNDGAKLHESNVKFFDSVFKKIGGGPGSVIEFGSNIGLNYLAMKDLYSPLAFTGVEINKSAHSQLEMTGCKAVHGSIFDFESQESYDLTFTKGVLIHINPERLDEVYEKLYSYSNKYILIAEYYNPQPVEVDYRGHSGKLFKRDFAGEIMDKFEDLTLVDYGFTWHRAEFPQDDLTWFLMEKPAQWS